mmetsp:Transcript_505/g.1089  ORF Transcript_505/g.1089 Transcript_505/m.1089 type:complete len:284 (-) Transcript_505:1069-1920(-)
MICSMQSPSTAYWITSPSQLRPGPASHVVNPQPDAPRLPGQLQKTLTKQFRSRSPLTATSSHMPISTTLPLSSRNTAHELQPTAVWRPRAETHTAFRVTDSMPHASERAMHGTCENRTCCIMRSTEAAVHGSPAAAQSTPKLAGSRSASKDRLELPRFSSADAVRSSALRDCSIATAAWLSSIEIPRPPNSASYSQTPWPHIPSAIPDANAGRLRAARTPRRHCSITPSTQSRTCTTAHRPSWMPTRLLPPISAHTAVMKLLVSAFSPNRVPRTSASRAGRSA